MRPSETRAALIARGAIVPRGERIPGSTPIDAPTLRLDNAAKKEIARQHFTCSGGCGAQTRSPYADDWRVDGPLSWCPACERRAPQ